MRPAAGQTISMSLIALSGDDRRPPAHPAGEQHGAAVGHDEHPPLPAGDGAHEAEQRPGGDDRRDEHRDQPHGRGQVEAGGQDRADRSERNDGGRAQERPQQDDAVLAAHQVHVLAGGEQTIDLGHAGEDSPRTGQISSPRLALQILRAGGIESSTCGIRSPRARRSAPHQTRTAAHAIQHRDDDRRVGESAVTQQLLRLSRPRSTSLSASS